jgi:hypothetical protein
MLAFTSTMRVSIAFNCTMYVSKGRSKPDVWTRASRSPGCQLAEVWWKARNHSLSLFPKRRPGQAHLDSLGTSGHLTTCCIWNSRHVRFETENATGPDKTTQDHQNCYQGNLWWLPHWFRCVSISPGQYCAGCAVLALPKVALRQAWWMRLETETWPYSTWVYHNLSGYE